MVQPNGNHDMSCRRSSGRQSRHHAVNAILARTLRSVDVPAMLEPPDLIRGDGKRPDGMTIVPWSGGRTMVWDFTCPDTLVCSLPADLAIYDDYGIIYDDDDVIHAEDLLY